VKVCCIPTQPPPLDICVHIMCQRESFKHYK
jgi:hypothetical protein